MRLSDNILNKVEGHKEKVGQLLLKSTSLTENQLQEALAFQKESGMLLGEILLKKNYIHPHDIIKVICQQIEVPYISEINVEEIDPNITANIPINYAKTHEILPIFETDVSVTVATTDPFNHNALNDMHETFNKDIKVVISSPLRILDAINRVYEKASRDVVDSLEDEFEENLDLEGPIDILDAEADEAPVIRFVHRIIFRAVKEKASDVHIEPYDKESIYRFRINGVMTEILTQPIKTHSAVVSRLKVMAKTMDIAEKRMPQDGRIKIKIAGKDIDIRINTVPVPSGERVVMRILEKGSKTLTLEQLGFEGKSLENLDAIARRRHGMIYVCGPTGSGKTTTLSAILDRIYDPTKMIITVEDPIEYDLTGISQVQVNEKIDLNFATVLRSMVRQDPDIIMVGETRDGETATISVQASLTGHLVLSTIHTNDAASAPNRLIDMGVQPFLIASSLVGILAQRLVQMLCDECKVPEEVNERILNLMGIDSIPPNATLYKAVGCPSCNHRGYSGRTVVYELLLVTDEIRELIMTKADANEVKKLATKQGMITIRQTTLEKVFRGITSVDEMMAQINVEEDTEE